MAAADAPLLFLVTPLFMPRNMTTRTGYPYFVSGLYPPLLCDEDPLWIARAAAWTITIHSGE